VKMDLVPKAFIQTENIGSVDRLSGVNYIHDRQSQGHLIVKSAREHSEFMRQRVARKNGAGAARRPFYSIFLQSEWFVSHQSLRT
jgi:hypothetical protein